MKNKKKSLILVLFVLSVCVAIGLAVTSFAAEEKTDAMTEIEAAFAEYKIGETQKPRRTNTYPSLPR